MGYDAKNWQGKSVLITGVCGTIGSELLSHLCELPLKRLVGVDNNESELFFLAEKYSHQKHVELSLTDIIIYRNLLPLFEDIDIVIHAAAYKHVILCEQSPSSAIETNIRGTQNIIDASISCGVERVLFTSSDKAVNPTNVMGTTKLMGERIITAANLQKRQQQTIFMSTRFGNVLGSRGSVIPLFKEQIKNGGPITITDTNMTRFIMSLREAIKLIMDSVFCAIGGEVFVTKMRTVRIVDLAETIIDLYAPKCGKEVSKVETKIIGPKAGEKLYEELLNSEEVRRTVELTNYFVIKPAFLDLYSESSYKYEDAITDQVAKPYDSSHETPISKAELAAYLTENELV